jgi:hypothetical protein
MQTHTPCCIKLATTVWSVRKVKVDKALVAQLGCKPVIMSLLQLFASCQQSGPQKVHW